MGEAAVGSHSFLPDPGIKPRSPTLQADSLPSETPGKPQVTGGYHVGEHVNSVPKHY